MTAFIQDEHGQKIGRDPRDMSPEDFEQAGIIGGPVLDAIRAKCLDCCADQRAEVAKCTAAKCALWPFRMGTNPFRAKREMSDEQRAAAGDRLRRAREARAA